MVIKQRAAVFESDFFPVWLFDSFLLFFYSIFCTNTLGSRCVLIMHS